MAICYKICYLFFHVPTHLHTKAYAIDYLEASLRVCGDSGRIVAITLKPVL